MAICHLCGAWWIIFAGVAPAYAASTSKVQLLMNLYSDIDKQHWTHGQDWVDQSTFARDACGPFPPSPFEI